MRLFKTILFICMVLILGEACEKTERVDNFPLEPSKLVVNCIYDVNSPFLFDISKSLSVLDNAPLANNTDATIYLYENDILMETITWSNSQYRSQLRSKKGARYRIKVSASGFPTATATALFSNELSINSVKLIPEDTTNGNHIRLGYEINIQDEKGVDDFYEISVYSSDYFNGDVKWLNLNEEDDYREVYDYYYDENNAIIFSDHLLDGQTITQSIYFNEYCFSESDSCDYHFFAVIRSLDKNAFLYRTTVNNQLSSRGDPFASPVQIKSNIENGYGIFAGSTSQVIELVYR